MPRIQKSHAYSMPKQDVIELAKELVTDFEKRFGMSCQWRGDKVVFKHMGTEGLLHIDETHVHLDVNLSFLLSSLAPSIKSEFDTFCRENLH